MADGKLGHMCGSMRAWQTVRGLRARWLGLISEHRSARSCASERPARAAAAWPASGCAASLVRCSAMGLEGGFISSSRLQPQSITGQKEVVLWSADVLNNGPKRLAYFRGNFHAKCRTLAYFRKNFRKLWTMPTCCEWQDGCLPPLSWL